MRILAILLTTCALLTSVALADDNEITFATVAWEPYAGEHLPQRGIASAIIEEACNRSGLKATFHFMPWTRAMDQTLHGNYDAVYNAYHSSERARNYAISDPYFRTILTLCTKADQSIDYDGTIESLRPYRLGVVRGYVNTEAIDNDTLIIKDEAETDLLNLRKLINDRVHVIVIDKFQALYFIKNNPTIAVDVNDIRFITPILEGKNLHALFSRKRPDWQKKLKRFNRGLQEIKRDGTLNEIMQRFGFSPPHMLENK